jgi:hypothetical protein
MLCPYSLTLDLAEEKLVLDKHTSDQCYKTFLSQLFIFAVPSVAMLKRFMTLEPGLKRVYRSTARYKMLSLFFLPAMLWNYKLATITSLVLYSWVRLGSYPYREVSRYVPINNSSLVFRKLRACLQHCRVLMKFQAFMSVFVMVIVRRRLIVLWVLPFHVSVLILRDPHPMVVEVKVSFLFGPVAL